MRKYLFTLLALIILSGGGFFVYEKLSTNDTQDQSSSSLKKSQAQTADKDLAKMPSTASNELFLGDRSARVTIVEYIDFKCPNCAKMHENIGKRLRTDFVDKKLANIQVRPIAFIGPDSRRAAEGAYCANDQGKFTHYHDAVFEYMWDQGYNKDDVANEFKDILSAEKLVEITTPHGIDGNALMTCINSGKHKSSVDADLKQSEKDGVTGTPHVIIDGKKIVGPQSYSTYKTLLDVALR